MSIFRLPRSTPEEQGVPASAVISFLDRLEREGQHHHSFMLLRHGNVIAQGSWSPYAPEHYHMLFSLSKSVTATAVGIAVNEGLLSVDDRITDIFRDELPAGYDKGYDKITVQHCLSMTTGQKDCFVFSMNRKGKNWIEHFFNIALEHEPGTKFMYNTGASFMLSAIVEKLSGQRLMDYLMPRLFEPLGIEKPFSQESPDGIAVGGWGLYLTIEDIAKIGQLYLDKGVFNGRRVLSEKWVEDATRKHIDPEGLTPDWQVGYGYQIWLGKNNTYRGDGLYGQYVVVMPDQDAVIAFTNCLGNGQMLMNTIYEELLVNMNSSGKLPPDPVSNRILQERLKDLKYYPATGSIYSPHAEGISKKRYSAEDNIYDYRELSLEFLTDNCLNFKFKDSQSEYSIIAEAGKWHENIGNKMRLSVGGSLQLGAVESPDYRPQPTFASYAWLNDNRLKILICYGEAPTHDEWIIEIVNDDSLSVSRNPDSLMDFNKRKSVLFTVV